MANRFMILGGDKRCYYLKNILQNDDNMVYNFIENPNFYEVVKHLSKIDYLVLPIPSSRDGVYITNTNIRFCDIIPLLNNVEIFLGCKEKIDYEFGNEKFYDIADNETFKQKNAILTVEGVLALSIKNTLRSIHGSKILIVGYGRIGSYLAKQLSSLGAKIFIVEKDVEKVKKCDNFVTDINLLEKNIDFDMIYNTVDENILNDYTSTTIFDISNTLSGYNIISTKSLPAIYSAYSSALIVAESIYSFINRGEDYGIKK